MLEDFSLCTRIGSHMVECKVALFTLPIEDNGILQISVEVEAALPLTLIDQRPNRNELGNWYLILMDTCM